MRLPESDIKSAILHPQEDVRLTAVGYFSDAFSNDLTVMPLVIQAVEKYGRETAFRILRDAERLPQTKDSIRWLSDELRRGYDTRDVAQDNYRFAVAIALSRAQVELLSADFIDLPAFPSELKPAVNERLDMASWNLETAWQAFETLGRQTMQRNEVTQADIRRSVRIIESLAQYPDDRGDFVMCLLRREYPPGDDTLMDWLDPSIIDLAGEMRLPQAIPVLMERLHEDDESVVDAAITALSKIGGDTVVEAIAEQWGDWSNEWCEMVADVMEHIHTDRSVQSCLEFLKEEEVPDVQIQLANALLGHFSNDAVELVRALVLGDEDDLVPDQRDLRYRLLAVATVMNVTFPDYDAWYAEALQYNWGWGDYEPARLADAFGAETVGPPISGNGRAG
jgi:hypothetical protein